MIDALPIWAVFTATAVIVMIAVEMGFHLGHGRRRASEDEKESPVSAIAGAILGLAAFMLAFTFSIVSDRYATRRALVREEAVAIRSAWLRSELLPARDHAQAVALLREYVDERIRFAEAATLEPDVVKTATARAEQIQQQLWTVAIANTRTDMNSDYASLYIEALDAVFGLHETRVAVAIQARIPNEIWLVLFCITVLGMIAVGYQTGIAGSKRSMAWPILAVSFAMVITLIASLDHVDSGVLHVTQQPLIDLRAAMAHASAPFVKYMN